MKKSRKFSLRGAAMVEAAVVLPVMVSFLGLTMMMRNAYTVKLTQNQQARSMALDYASHQCQRQVISYGNTSRSSGSAGVGSGVGAADSNSAEALANAPGQAKTSGFMAKTQVTYASTTIINPKPNTSTRGMGLTLKVNSLTSTAVCNETPEDGSFSGMFGYVKGKISGAAN